MARSLAALTLAGASVVALRAPAPATMRILQRPVTLDRGAFYDRLLRLGSRPLHVAPQQANRTQALTQAARPFTARPAYSVPTSLQDASGSPGYPFGVNNLGQIAFYDQCGCTGPFSSNDQSYVINGYGPLHLQGPMDTWSIARALNDVGGVAGQWLYEIIGPPPLAFNITWLHTTGNAYYSVDYQGGYDTGDDALAINNVNVSVGVDPNPARGNTFAAEFAPGKRIDLLPPKGTTCSGIATGINDSGNIVPVGPANVESGAAAINQHGDIVGYAGVGRAGGEAFLYEPGKTIYVPRPHGDAAGPAAAIAVNANPDVLVNVGSSATHPNGTVFLYKNGQSYDLNALLPANSGWQLVDGLAMNDHGEVVGEGYYRGTLMPYSSSGANGGVKSAGLACENFALRLRRYERIRLDRRVSIRPFITLTSCAPRDRLLAMPARRSGRVLEADRSRRR